MQILTVMMAVLILIVVSLAANTLTYNSNLGKTQYIPIVAMNLKSNLKSSELVNLEFLSANLSFQKKSL